MFTKIRKGPLIGVALAVVGFVAVAPAAGVVVRDDPSLHEVGPDSAFNRVGYLSCAGGTTGVLISPDYILTAGHAVGGVGGHTFTLELPDGPRVYGLAEKFAHPTEDLALVRLEVTTGLDGYALYEGDDEADRIGVIAGYGVSGIGEPDADAWPRGTLRVGYNYIDAAPLAFLQTDFDGGPDYYHPLSASEEVMPADGDSGGPVFIDDGGVLKLAGIHICLTDFDGDGVTPEYGDRCYHVRVSACLDWLHEMNPQLPEPGGLALLAVGLPLIAVRRRRRAATGAA